MNIQAQAVSAIYPVSRTEAKSFCRIPASNTLDDSLVDLLIASAVDGVERATGLSLTSRKYVGYIDGFPMYPFSGGGFVPLFGSMSFLGMGVGYTPNGPIGDIGRFPFSIAIPMNPVTSVQKIVYLDLTGAETTLLPGVDFVVDLGATRVRVGPIPGGAWPLQTLGLSSVRIFFTAGYSTPITVGVTNVSVASNVLTVQGTNAALLSAGQELTFGGVTTATFLNGQSVIVATANAAQFTAAFTHADYASAADTGNATTTGVCDVTISGTPTPPKQNTDYRFVNGIPARLKQLMLLMINEGYTNRSINVAGAVGTIPTADDILSLFTTHDYSVDRT